jgi:predicted Zn-dependent protease
MLAAFGCATATPPIEPGVAFVRDPEEVELWQASEQLERDYVAAGAISGDAALTRYVEGVAQRLIEDDLNGTGLRLTARVALDPYRNAFATPNGTLYVNTGLLCALDNEAQLASVIGHEIAHFTRRHSLREKRVRDRNQQVVSAGDALMDMAGGLAGVVSLPLIVLGELAVAPGLEALALGYSRDLEREADRVGFDYLARAGYDRAEGAHVFARLREELISEGVEEPYLFGSHPRLAEREASYAEMLAAAGAGAGDRNDAAYASAIRGALLENASLDLALSRPALARAAIERHLAIDPTSPDGWYWKAELSRRQAGGSALDEAVPLYLRALELEPAHPRALRALGLLHRARGRDQEARDFFARYLEADPGAVDRVLVASYLEPERGRLAR